MLPTENAAMTAAEIREAIRDILHDIAPDEDLSGLKEDVPFREQLELDSMDFLDIVMELRKRTASKSPKRSTPSWPAWPARSAIWNRGWRAL